MFATPRAKHLASRIAEVLESYRQDPQQFQAFRSPGEWRRAQSLARLFPKSLNEAQIRETLSDPQVFNAGQLLLGDPDLLNFAAEALPFYENTSPLPAKPPSHIAGLRQQLPNNRPAGPEKLQADPFWCLVYNISQIRNWRDLLDQQAEPFDQVLREELVQIVASREKREINAPKPDYSGSIEETAESCHLMGLAFSGGGIRSATVALGVLQGLAQLRLLSWFDYLSTVSGGGYIGAWLSAWIKRSDFKNDANQPSPSDAALPSKAAQTSLGFLRRFSNYLTPELGFLSADTWTLFAIWFRNILLNLGVIIPGILGLLLLPREVQYWFAATARMGNYSLIVAFALLLFPSCIIAINLSVFRRTDAFERAEFSRFSNQPWIQGLIVIPLIISAWFGAANFYFYRHTGWVNAPLVALLGSLVMGATLWALGYASGFEWCFVHDQGKLTRRTAAVWRKVALLMLAGICLLCAALAALLNYFLSTFIQKWALYRPEGILVPMAWGPLLMGLSTTLVVVLFLGLTGRSFPDDRREWWSRLGAWLFIYAMGWGAWMIIALYGPYIFSWTASHIPVWADGAITFGWAFTTAAGLAAAMSRRTGPRKDGPDSGSKLEFLIRIAPYVFIGGLLLLTAFTAHWLLAFETCPDTISMSPAHPNADANTKRRLQAPPYLNFETAWDLETQAVLPQNLRTAPPVLSPIQVPAQPRGCEAATGWQFSKDPDYAGYWELVTHTDRRLLGIDILLCAILVALLAWKVDINEFSMHHFYRNRLVRCYLGASSRTRNANPFTGLDFDDDIPLARFKANEHQYFGPYPIINTTLNLSRGEDLAYQERKASSFAFTPLYCGFYSPQHPGQRVYRPTERYAYRSTGVHYGTAMAISGAAASPNWGYHTSPAMAFLMTIFDVRLGWWMGNPLKKSWRKSSPPLNLGYLFFELLGLSSARSKFVYLSDGGHFDNMGLYELIHRRCRFIVLVDAEEDANFTFEGLGMAIRKCRIDFGVDIDLDVERLRTRTEDGRSQSHCVVGDVWYPQTSHGHDAANRTRGTIVYIKSSLTGDEPSDVLEYSLRNPPFPHESTGDQFFTESQFESYRQLGLHLALKTFQDPQKESTTLQDRARFVVRLRQNWYAPSPAIQQSFTKHAADLDKIWERLRSTPALEFLNRELYPEWRALMEYAAGRSAVTSDSWLPQDEASMRSGFYFCNELIQIMETVYMDLDLQSESDHPDNRGWMNLFRHWSHAGMFRVTWAIAASTYGARFQTFCQDNLQLKLGKVVVSRRPLTPLERSRYLNNHEQKIIDLFRRGPGRKYDAALAVYALRLSVDPPVSQKRGRSFQFTFGFALVHDGGLLAFRVQDHLRQMGLGRRGLAKLVQPGGGEPPMVTKEALLDAPDLRDLISDPGLDEQLAWQKRTLGVLLDDLRSRESSSSTRPPDGD